MQGVRMPPLGQTSDELRIVSWLKKEGDSVEQGEPLFEVETDKAKLEVESFSSGVLRKILHKADEVVEVGTLIAYIGHINDELPGEISTQEMLSTTRESHISNPVHDIAGAGIGVSSDIDKPLASPPVRALMRTHGIDPRQVTGSGPGGRIERRDVEALIQQVSSETKQSLFMPVPKHRQIIAQRLTQSVQTIPQITLTSVINMWQTQAALQAGRERGITHLTYTHLILRAVAQTLRKHLLLNTLWEANGPQFQQLAQVNVGLAVSREESLLIVTIPEPDRLSLTELVKVTDAAIERGRKGALAAVDIAPAALTVSNLGMYGVDSFTAIVDPAQTAILAIGRIVEQPCVLNGNIAIIPQMKVTLVVDHRIADGTEAALFLSTLGETLERQKEDL
jgi:pyruvate dehydrogenase E2 component (dihydrolipoamide acetyltransferase)